MSNTILTHYAKKLELNQKADRFLAGIIKESGFASEKEIWRGLILGDKKKAGSVIYAGRYKNKPAVLKIQHLKPVIDEPEIIRKFYQHSKSRKVFAPKIYFDRPWNRSRGYGYFISEIVKGLKLVQICPSASTLERSDWRAGNLNQGIGRRQIRGSACPPMGDLSQRDKTEPTQMREFCKFYEDYKANIKMKPGWWPKRAEEKDTVIFNLKRSESWLKIVKAARLLKPEFYQPKVDIYKKIIKKYAANQPMEFTHGHLSAHDIIKTKQGKYYLMSNFLWSYRPKWYDLAFNLWVNINGLPEMSYNEVDRYIERWLENYNEIKTVTKDKNFERYFWLNLLERALGSILVDFGSVRYPVEKRAMARVNFKRWEYIFGEIANKFKM